MVASESPKPRTPRARPTAKSAGTRSGNPATRARAKAETSPSAPATARSTAASWKKADTAGAAEDVLLPSGNVALLRRVSPETFIAKKMIPDSISGIVQQAIEKNQGLKPKDEAALMRDPDKIADAIKFMDTAVCYAVVDPQINAAPEDESERDSGLLYVDQVDLNDKIFIFNWASGGSSDLARFRSEFGDAVSRLDAGEDVPLSSV